MTATVALSAASVAGASRTVTAPIPATVSLIGDGPVIPPSFLGISMEYNQLTPFEQAGPALHRVLSLIAPQNGSSQILRIGGKSADHTLWEPAVADPAKLPFDLGVIGTPWLNGVSTLVRADRLKLMLDLNLAVHSPAMETAFASAVQSALPPGSLAGVEIGNEPDLYKLQPDLAQEGTAAGLKAPEPWYPRAYGAAAYRSDYLAYAASLHAALPSVALGGPDTISAKQPWLNALEGLGPLAPAVLTVHRYAGSSCWPATSRLYPKITHLLSRREPVGLADSVLGAVALARENGQSVRLTEMNSISCGGNAGVADAFATALWAPQALLEMVRAGVSGVNWHLRPHTVNAPFDPSTGAIAARPELYGLAAFAQLTGPDARLLSTIVSAPRALGLEAWAVRADDGMRVLLINPGATAGRVRLELGVAGRARVKRLTAPSVQSTTGVTFGGQTIGPDGGWQGRLDAPNVPESEGAYTLTVQAGSAALVTIRRPRAAA